MAGGKYTGWVEMLGIAQRQLVKGPLTLFSTKGMVEMQDTILPILFQCRPVACVVGDTDLYLEVLMIRFPLEIFTLGGSLATEQSTGGIKSAALFVPVLV